MNITARISNIAMLALAVLPAAALTTAAHAQTAVRVGDLNLASASGKAVYEQRLNSAARQYCSGEAQMSVRAACETAVRAEVNDKLAANTQFASRS
ncbi:MAG TPA: UrcA family protein [Phenylobacterium sp.]|jgi:UrcA family protein